MLRPVPPASSRQNAALQTERADRPSAPRCSRRTLVYDRGRDVASCLNEFAARVWRECDGETSVIAALGGEDERAVWLALHQLNKSKLLMEEIALPPDMRTGKTRREIAGQLGLGAAVAAVSSIVMTTAAHAGGDPLADQRPYEHLGSRYLVQNGVLASKPSPQRDASLWVLA